MNTRPIVNVKRLCGMAAVRTAMLGAVLGAAAALAEPASAAFQSSGPRTGKLHQDCNEFSVAAMGSGGGYALYAHCRFSDDKAKTRGTQIDLDKNIGAKDGRLTWNLSNRFHWQCGNISVRAHSSGVTLSAACYRSLLQAIAAQVGNRRMGVVNSTLELGDYSRVNWEGALELK